MTTLTESVVEEAALAWLESLGYTLAYGPDIAPDGIAPERSSYSDVVLTTRLQSTLARLNTGMPTAALDDAFRTLTRSTSPVLVQSNRDFHRMLIDGVPVTYRRTDGEERSERVRVIDFDNPLNNNWLAVKQFTVQEGNHTRRADVVLFLNGLPLAVFELKNAANSKAGIWDAYNQLQTYKQQIGSLFVFNEALVISDGTEARIGSLTANRERFQVWRTVGGEAHAPASMPQLQVLIRGVFDPQHFLDLLRFFIVFEDAGAGAVEKKLAAYHQFHAVNRAVESTIAAASPGGDRRGGVVWHTQGSGKSLTMVFYAGRLVTHPAMQNPTIVVLTDRIDLDNQLFGVFARCSHLLRQAPVQANDRAHLRELLKVASGGVVFTTIQKFLPTDEEYQRFLASNVRHGLELSDRSNIVVIADEAHRSQYGFNAKVDLKTGEVSYGLAQYVRDALPAASFLGFTGTPIELTDRNTRQVFGDHIHVYDIREAVDDHATVPIYYENRVAKLDLNEQEKPRLDPEFEEVTEGEEIGHKEALKSKWTALEAIVGTEKRLALIAADMVAHFEQRLEVMDGKAMIVCMSRRICFDLYNQIIKLRPEWHSEDDSEGTLKVIMTGSASDPLEWQPHIRTKSRREAMAVNFRDPAKPFKMVIVRDMWLTGFDAPSLHTMYIDKPMRGHSLMQAIARVNRVFRDKPGGLVVDYIGLVDQLKLALANYTQSGGQGNATVDQEVAIKEVQRYAEVCRDLFHGFDWSEWITGSPSERVSLLPAAQEHILDQQDGPARLNEAVTSLSKALALAMPADEALAIRDDVTFFQAVRAALVKTTASNRPVSNEQIDHAVRQLVSKAIAPDQIIDVFEAAGIAKPDISILSDEFLNEIQGMPQRNLAVELLRKLLNDEIKARSHTSVVQARVFSEMLEKSVRLYQSRAIETAQIIERLIELAKHLRAADQRGENTGLTPEEFAFYEALAESPSAQQVLGDDMLKAIARELTEALKRNASIDWTVRESVRAKMRVLVKRILRKHGYPPEQTDEATKVVIDQAELLSEAWAV